MFTMMTLCVTSASLLLTLVLPGYGFLYPPGAEQPSYSKNRESPSDLNRRYWNDEIAVCIKKYCKIYQSASFYTRCLLRHCPDAVAPIPARDLDDVVNRDVTDTDINDATAVVLTSLPLLSTSLICVWQKCLAQPANEFVQCARTCGDVNDDNPRYQKSLDWRMSYSLSEVLNNLCKETFCSGVSQANYGRCLLEKCVGLGMMPTDKAENVLASPPDSVTEVKALDNKRRINDPVSQCIQSYCGDKGFDTKTTRMLCIVTKCHRPTG